MKRFFLIYICLGICWPLFSQTDPAQVPITYSTYKNSLKNVLIDLSNKAGVNISFNDELIAGRDPINITVRNEPLGNILDVLLSDINVTYKVVGDQIVLFREEVLSENKKKDKNKNRSTATISGYLSDVSSGERLVYGTVYLSDNSAGVTSNEYGFYSFTLEKGREITLIYSYIGYKKVYHRFTLESDTLLNVSLDSNIELEEIIINDTVDVSNPALQETNPVPLDQMNSMVGLGGVNDVIRTASLMPGVTSGADGFGGMHIRGGNVDHNLILLDGAPIYNATHSLGLFSIFNSSTIKSAQLIKGSFPARYGGRLASVLDVRTREGNTQELHGELSIGLLTAKATIEGPLKKGKSGFLLSARRTFLDPWIKQATRFQNDRNNSEGFSTYYFFDVNAKAHFQLGSKNKIFFSYYEGRDNFENSSEAQESVADTTFLDYNEDLWDWGNRLATVRLNSQLSQKSFLNLTFIHSDFKFNSFEHQRFSTLLENEIDNLIYNANLFESSIVDYGVRAHIDIVPSPSHYIKIGAEYTRHQFNPGLIYINQEDEVVEPDELVQKSDLESLLDNPKIQAQEINAYIEDDMRLSQWLRANVGLRASLFSEGNSSFLSIQPRISVVGQIGPRSRFKAAYTNMSQNLHLVSNSGLGLPTDLWLPATSKVGPETAWQLSGGFSFDLNKEWNLSMEAYTKKMTDILSFNEGQVFTVTDNNNWEDRVPKGNGSSKGVELMIQKHSGKFTGWVNYTLSFANRQFDLLNNGNEFRYRYDRRHYLKLAFVYHFAKSTDFSLNWEFGSGNPITIPISVFDEGGIQLFYPERNNEELPVYHKLDVGFNFYSKFSWGGMQKFSLGVYNAYNRKNPFYVDLQRDSENLQSYRFVQYSILPILPSVSYTISF